MKPSHLLFELRKLLTLPTLEEGEPEKSVDLIREVVLTTLPPTVRAAIPDASTMDEEKFLNLADSLMSSHTSSRQIIAPATHDVPPPQETQENDAHVAPLREKWKKQYRPSWRPNQQQQTYNLCFFHQKFGDRAYRCEGPPCTKSKNFK